MYLFDSDLVADMNGHCTGEAIYFVGLGLYDFQLAFGNIKGMQNYHRVDFCIRGQDCTWQEGPSEAPVWLLLGQVPNRFQLVDTTILRMQLDSGDVVDFYTAESPYECHTIQLAKSGDRMEQKVF